MYKCIYINNEVDMKISEKRLVIEIDRNLHHDIKKRALDKKLTIKAWIMVAIAKAIKDESDAQIMRDL